ncbi:MAG: heme peroxidase family protein [Actinomycetota bacterium]|nr:heme peroxidase family protein [Actinomycetota bacterium]
MSSGGNAGDAATAPAGSGGAAPQDKGGAHQVVGPLRTNHGASPERGLDRVPRSILNRGRYGRMFRNLPPFVADDQSLKALADAMFPYPPAPPVIDASPAAEPSAAPPLAAPPAATQALTGGPSPDANQPGENPDIPAGYTYLGQFIDHDITFDPTSMLGRQNDPDGLVDFRTPRFDLDSLYGSGVVDSPFLYDQDDPVKLLVGTNSDPQHEPQDLPRNQQGRALLADPRNDFHVIISQLTLAFIRFHNAVVDHLRDQFFPDTELFAEAQRLVRWHYQWIVIEDYLRSLVGSELVDQILVPDAATGGRAAKLRFFRWQRNPFMPVEFSAAAFRFGHSQVRATYQLNADLDPIHIMLPTLYPNPLEHLGGFRPLPRHWKIEWDMFFSVGGSQPQLSRRIDSKIVGPLGVLTPTLDQKRHSIALLDLLRGKALGLPSGQAVACAMGTAAPDTQLGLSGPAPLWYYLLKEAEVLADGRRLGPTGGRIVAEVLVGLLAADPSSFLRAAPNWKPELPGAEPGHFTVEDLLHFAGAV